MADIKQAAVWLMESRRVRNSAFSQNVWLFRDGSTVMIHNGYASKSSPPEYPFDGFDIFTLLAEDWEIAE